MGMCCRSGGRVCRAIQGKRLAQERFVEYDMCSSIRREMQRKLEDEKKSAKGTWRDCVTIVQALRKWGACGRLACSHVSEAIQAPL